MSLFHSNRKQNQKLPLKKKKKKQLTISPRTNSLERSNSNSTSFQLSDILPMSETKHLCLVCSLSLSCKDRCWHVKEILKCRVPRGIMTGEESKTCILALAAPKDMETKEMRSLEAVRRNQPCDFCVMPFYSPCKNLH